MPCYVCPDCRRLSVAWDNRSQAFLCYSLPSCSWSKPAACAEHARLLSQGRANVTQAWIDGRVVLDQPTTLEEAVCQLARRDRLIGQLGERLARRQEELDTRDRLLLCYQRLHRDPVYSGRAKRAVLWAFGLLLLLAAVGNCLRCLP